MAADGAVALVAAPGAALAPGLYVARASDPAYGWLDALVVEGAARYVGERYDIDGQKEVAVAVGDHTPNQGEGGEYIEGQVGIGHEFFSTALRDYHDWQEKWWREAIQNSVDAGASEITCSVETTDEGVVVTCTDNGRGMDQDTLLNKFLRLGGTTKTGLAGSRGGFGKAKELLLFPWIAWRIETRDTEVVGSGIQWKARKIPERRGTTLRVVMAPDQCTHAAAAISFITKCALPGVRFLVNGEAVQADLRLGEAVREFEGKATLYHDKDRHIPNSLIVRTMGLYMFSTWVSDAVEGTLIVELTGPSIDLLTANRDGFRDRELKQSVERFANQLAADVKSALRKEKGLIRKKFKGTGKFQGAPEHELKSEILTHLEEVIPRSTEKGQPMLSTEQVTVVKQVIAARSGGAAEAEEGAPAVRASRALSEPGGESAGFNFRVTPELAEAMLDGTVMPGTASIEAMVKQLSWEPDFYLVNEVEGFKVPKTFYPEHMSAHLRKLARLWAELCRFVLIQLGSSEAFGVGFLIDSDRGAEYRSEEEGDEHWLMLNPFKEPKRLRYRSDDKKVDAEDLLSTTNDDDVAWLYAAAVHECTHMADGISYHDESFAAALTQNFAKTTGKDRQIRAIRKAVSARRPRPEGAAPRGPKVAGLPPLADAELERVRVAKAKQSPAPYVTFYSDDAYTDRGWEDLGEAKSYATAYATMEVRDVRGKPVFRSANFALPVAKAKGGSPALPELSDAYLREARTDTAKSYSELAGTAYVGFKDESTQVWDHSSDLKKFSRQLASEQEGTYTYFEIRDTVSGAPVWRSAGFPEQALQHAANRAGAYVSVADMDPDELLIGTEHELEHTDDPDEAERIALDHLAEDPHYYSRLAACGIDGSLVANPPEGLYVEGPLSQGSPWTLHYGDEKAIVSEFTAVALAARHDVPMGRDGRPGAIKEGTLGLDPSVYTGPMRLSKKAAALLTRAGIRLSPNQYQDEDEGPHSWKPNGSQEELEARSRAWWATCERECPAETAAIHSAMSSQSRGKGVERQRMMAKRRAEAAMIKLGYGPMPIRTIR